MADNSIPQNSQNPKIIITKGSNLNKSVKDSLDIISKDSAIIKKGEIIFIQIDLSVPEGYPSITNQTLLSKLVNWCLRSEPSKIYIGSIPLFGISSEYVWISMGFSTLLTDKRVEFIALEKEIPEKNPKKEMNISGSVVHYPELVLNCNKYISVVNVKADPIYQLQLGTYNSLSLLEWKERITIIKENERNFIADLHLIKQPDIIIYDLTNIISHAGPFIYSDTEFIQSEMICVSNDSILAESVVNEILGFKMEENIILNTIKEKDTNLLNKSRLNQFSLISQEISQDQKDNIKVIDLIAHPNDLTVIKFSRIPKIQDIFPKRIFLYEGRYDSGMKRALYDLVFLMKTALIKDFENIDGLNILIGENPPEPENIQKIKTVVFGDDAIRTSDNMDFRIIKSQKKVKSEEELEKARIKYQSDQRDKLLDWESKKVIIKENIAKQFKDDPEKQDRALKSLEKRDVKFKEDQEKKYSNFVLKQNKKQVKAIEKSKIIKYKLNKKILEIQGNPPQGFEYVGVLIKFLGKSWVPTLSLYNNIMEQCYNREEYVKQHKIYAKERRKIYKKRIEDKKEKKKKKQNNKNSNEQGKENSKMEDSV